MSLRRAVLPLRVGVVLLHEAPRRRVACSVTERGERTLTTEHGQPRTPPERTRRGYTLNSEEAERMSRK